MLKQHPIKTFSETLSTADSIDEAYSAIYLRP